MSSGKKNFCFPAMKEKGIDCQKDAEQLSHDKSGNACFDYSLSVMVFVYCFSTCIT